MRRIPAQEHTPCAWQHEPGTVQFCRIGALGIMSAAARPCLIGSPSMGWDSELQIRNCRLGKQQLLEHGSDLIPDA
jgi:hypothetical protein